jgi:FG-GAP-like repeat
MMKTNDECKASSQYSTAHILRNAIVAASVLALGNISSAEAGTEASESPQSNFVLSATCHTAPARNTPRKRAAVAEVYNRSSSTSIMVLPSTGTAFGAPQLFAQNDGGFSGLDRWSAGDFDGDGDQDLIAAWNDGGMVGLAFRQAVGNTFVTSQLLSPSRVWSADTIWVPGNFDNIGRAQLAAIFKDGSSTSIDVYTFGRTFVERRPRMTRGIPWVSTTKWSVGDFDGEGTDDLVSVAESSSGTAASIVWLANTSGHPFAGSTWSNVGGWSDTTKYVAGDFTGDGKADLAGIWDNGGAPSVAVYQSSGSAFFYPAQWLHLNPWFNTGDRWVVGYFDDDNKVDLVHAFETDRISSRSVYLANATGTAFVSGFFAGAGTGAGKPDASICSGVFNAQ